jgi:hypothetical protein
LKGVLRSEPLISRGFVGKRRRPEKAGRIPPGQYLTEDFPVLSAGLTPRSPLDRWSFTIEGLVREKAMWTWEQFMQLPQQTFVVDISCVTKWTKLNTKWEGVSLDTLLEHVELDRRSLFATAWSDGGYTTNLPLEDALNGRAFVAHRFGDQPLAPEHGGWQIATLKAIKQDTAQVYSFTFALPDWTPHRAGRHYDIRLTAEDGYQAQRSYSITSEPERTGEIDLTVAKIADGEVSPYLHDVLIPGGRIEMRGPIGGYFVWEVSMRDPLLLIAGGSGVVPLMSMLRHRAAAGGSAPARLLYSSRTRDDVIYYDELE